MPLGGLERRVILRGLVCFLLLKLGTMSMEVCSLIFFARWNSEISDDCS